MRYIGPGSEPVEGHDYTATLEIADIGADRNDWQLRDLTGNGSFTCQCGATISGPAEDVRDFAFAHFAEQRASGETPAERTARLAKRAAILVAVAAVLTLISAALTIMSVVARQRGW